MTDGLVPNHCIHQAAGPGVSLQGRDHAMTTRW